MITYKVTYLSLKSKNVVKFYVHISPVFSCRVTYYTYIEATVHSIRYFNGQKNRFAFSADKLVTNTRSYSIWQLDNCDNKPAHLSYIRTRSIKHAIKCSDKKHRAFYYLYCILQHVRSYV